MATLGNPIHISMTLDTQGVKKGITDAQNQFSQLSKEIQSESQKINVSTGSIVRGFTALAGINLGLSGIRDFGNEVIRMTGTMQGLQLSFETMLQSKSAADKMMMDVKNFALATPYTITETASTVKQLIAMNAAGDDVMQTYKALGDVAAGLNVPLQRIAVNFGQVAALGKLQAREVRDFAMAGVPIWDELANVMGKSVNEVQALVSAGQIGFPDVLKAFQNMSGEGGRFANMMEKMNSTVLGQVNRLKDQIEQMFAAIGEGNTGVIYGAINGAANLVSAYKEIIAILGTLIATYGSYWAAQKVVNVVDSINQGARYRAEIAELEKLILAKKSNQNTDLQQLVTDKQLSASQAQRIAALRAELVEEEKANVRRAQMALDRIRQEKEITAATLERIAQIGLVNKNGDPLISNGRQLAVTKDLQTELDTLNNNKNTLARKANTLAIQEQMAIRRLDAANIALSTKQTQLNTVSTTANVTAQKGLSVVLTNIGKGFKSLWATMASNPIGLVLAGLTLAVSVVRKLTEAQREANKAHEESVNAMLDEQAQVNKLVRDIQNVNKSEKERKQIYDELNRIAPQVTEDVKNEASAYEQLTQRLKEYNALKITELALSNFQFDNGFDKAAKQLLEDQKDFDQAQANIRNSYIVSLRKFQELINENRLPETMVEQFNKIIISGLPEATQMQQMSQLLEGQFNEVYDHLMETARQRGEELSKFTATHLATTITHRTGSMGEYNPYLFGREELQALHTYNAELNNLTLSEQKFDDAAAKTNEQLDTQIQILRMKGVSESIIQEFDAANRVTRNFVEVIDTTNQSIEEFGNISEMSFQDMIDLLPTLEIRLEQMKSAATIDQTAIDNLTNYVNALREAVGITNQAEAGTKSYYEQIAKKAEADRQALDITQLGTKAETDLIKIRDEAEKQAAKWNRPKAPDPNEAKRKAQKEAEDQERIQRELNQLLLDLQKDYEDSVIGLMEDGAEKEKAILLRRTTEQIKQLQSRYIAIALAQGGTIGFGFEDTEENRQMMINGGLTEEQVKAYFDAIIVIEKTFIKESSKIEEEDREKSLRGFQTYQERLQSELDDYLERRNKAIQAGASTGGLDIGFMDFLSEYTSDALSNSMIDEEFREWANGIQQIAQGAIKSGSETILTETIANLNSQLEFAKDVIENIIADGEINTMFESGMLEDALARIQALQSEIDKLEGKGKDSAEGFKDWGAVNDLFRDSVDIFKQVGDTIGGVTGEILGQIGQTITTFGQLINSIQSIIPAAQAASTAISAMQTASIVLLAISAALQIVTFGITSMQKASKDSFNTVISGLDDQIKELEDRFNNPGFFNLKDSGALDEMYAAIDEFGQAYRDMLNESFSVGGVNFKGPLTSGVKETKAFQEAVKKLSNEFKNAGYNANKLTGTQKWKQTGEQIANVSQRILLIQTQIEETTARMQSAKTKKSEKEQLANDLKAYQQQLQDAINEGIEINTNAIDAMLGTTSDEIAQRLTDALRTAFQNGESAAEAWGKTVDEIINDMVFNMMVLGPLQEQIKGIIDTAGKKLQSLEESNMSEESKRLREEMAYEDLAKALNGIDTSVYEKVIEWLKENFGFDAEAEINGRTSASQAFAQASQESIDALFGIVTNIENSVYLIAQAERTRENALSVSRVIASDVHEIRQYTSRLMAMEDYLRGMSMTLIDVESGINALNGYSR